MQIASDRVKDFRLWEHAFDTGLKSLAWGPTVLESSVYTLFTVGGFESSLTFLSSLQFVSFEGEDERNPSEDYQIKSRNIYYV